MQILLGHSKIVAGIPLAFVSLQRICICQEFCICAVFLNVCSQFSCISFNAEEATADPNERNKMLMSFVSAVCSFELFISAACRGFCSVVLRVNSVIEIAYLAFTAMTNRSHYFSHSVLGGFSATSQ